MADSPEDERQNVVDYLASEAPGETVEHLEKVAHERILGRDTEVWDVHTNKERWWVITPPMNLYSQAQIPSLSIALSFHVGLTARVEARQERTAPGEFAARFPNAWRQYEQAGEELARAVEAQDYQAVGMRCRESLIAFAREASSRVNPPPDERPKAGDFVAWADLLANAVASGTHAERLRGYLKVSAKATWELANWLTHSSNADHFDALFAVKATEHTLSFLTLSVFRSLHGAAGPPKCAVCGSYQWQVDSVVGVDGASYEVPRCRICGSRCEPRKRRICPSSALVAKPKSQCVSVDIPLKGPKPPKPSSMD